MPKPKRHEDRRKLQDKMQPDAALEDQLWAMRNLLQIPDRHLAPSLGVSITTLRRWRDKGSDDPVETVENLRVVVAEIAATGQKDPPAIGAWLRSRNRALGFERPLDLLEETNGETIGWIADAGIAFARSYSLPESAPHGTPPPSGSTDLGGRVKPQEPVSVNSIVGDD